MQVPHIKLTDGVEIPQLGYGVFQIPPDETSRAVTAALQAGYRSIDTATAYRNEEAVGKAIAATGLRHEDLFITTKLWNSDQGYDSTLRAFDASVQRLGIDVLDLYLIHWPQPERELYVDTWRAFEKLHADGRVRAIGVSNFTERHLRRLLDECDVPPAINQVELHPQFPQQSLRAFHAEHGIATEAWGPLAQGELLTNETLRSLADKYRKSPAQVMLRWHIQLGNVVIPKTVSPTRMAENLAVFDFELAEDDMKVIGELDTGTRVGPDPETFNRVWKP